MGGVIGQRMQIGWRGLFGDGGVVGGIANKFMRAPENTVEGDLGIVYGGTQAYRHTRRTNVAWADGHVAAVNRAHPGIHATEALLTTMDFPANGFLSNDDSAYRP